MGIQGEPGTKIALTVVGAFLTGWPSIIAVILNYVKRSEVRGTWLESHFRWQIRTWGPAEQDRGPEGDGDEAGDMELPRCTSARSGRDVVCLCGEWI